MRDCFYGFRAEAQERGVTLNFSIPTTTTPGLRRNSSSFQHKVNASLNLIIGKGSGSGKEGPSIHLTANDTITLDKNKINHVLRSLISNAIKFSSRGGVATLHAVFVPCPHAIVDKEKLSSPARQMLNMISASMRPPFQQLNAIAPQISPQPPKQHTVGYLRISIIDYGVGLSAENQERLFNEIIQFNPEKLQAGGNSFLNNCISFPSYSLSSFTDVLLLWRYPSVHMLPTLTPSPSSY